VRSSKAKEARLSRASRALHHAGRALNYLMRLTGDRDEGLAGYAISGLFHLLTNAVENFHHSAQGEVFAEKYRATTEQVLGPQPSRRPHFAKWARKADKWPVLYHAHAEKRAQVEEVVKALHLAEDLGLNFSGKSFSFTTPANAVALKFYEFIEPHRGRSASVFVKVINGRTLTDLEEEALHLWIEEHLHDLPKLSRAADVLKEWRTRGEQLLPFLYGPEFQKHPDLKRFAKHAEKTKEGIPARWSERKLIKKALGAAWENVARHVGGE
jgi:hypothetical protein